MISRQRKWQIKMAILGCCPGCGGAMNGATHTRCPACIERAAQRRRAKGMAPMASRRSLTPAQDRYAVRRYREGVGPKAIARHFGVSVNAVRRALERSGISFKRRLPSRDQLIRMGLAAPS